MSSVEENRVPGRSAVLVIGPKKEDSEVKIDGLVKFCGLAKYGRSLLTPATLSEMRMMAWILLIICIFEMAVWTSFFNVILGRDIQNWGVETLVAAALSSIFVAIIFFFERGMLTYDSDKSWKILLAGSVRVFFIGVTVYFVTSVGFELWFFRPAILERAKEEAVRGRVVAAWGDVKAKRRQADLVEKNVDIQNELNSARRELEGVTRQLATSRKKAEVIRTQVDPTDAATSSLLRSAEIDSETAAGRRKELLETIEELRDRLFADAGERDKRKAQLLDEASTIEKDLRSCIAGLTGSEMSCSRTGFYADPPVPDFQQQRRILDDFAQAREPQWKIESEQERRDLVKDLGFPDIRCSGSDTASPACEQLKALQRAYLDGHRISLIVGGLIPFLMVIFKFLMLPAELRDYYSQKRQAEATQYGR